MNTKYSAIAPIITTILLVVVAVILVTMFLSFGKNFTTSALDKTNSLKDLSKADASDFVYPKSFSQGVIQFNFSPPANQVVDEIIITGYKILTDNNETIDVNLSTNYTLTNGSNIINLTDFSELSVTDNKINIQLVTTDNQYIMLKNITNPPAAPSAPALELPHVMNGEVELYIYPTDNHAGIVWGCSGTAIGAQSTTDGSANTTAIMDDCAFRPIAASVCADLDDLGYDDWYLPTTGELTAIWNACEGIKTNLCMNAAIDKGDYADDWEDITGLYWTSLEIGSISADIIFMTNGGLYENLKTETYSVRCVRSD